MKKKPAKNSVVQRKEIFNYKVGGTHSLRRVEKAQVPSFLKPYGNRMLDRHSSVGVGAHYGLDGPEIESRWR